jgi:pimeloyl-[acyl-carrier protein] methyl ester esterase
VSEKPAILLLPGLDGTGRLFDRLVRELEPLAHVHIISYPSERFLGYSDLAKLVARQAPAGAYAIVAESFSGPVAVMVGASRPAGLRGIILSASFVVPPAPRWLRVIPFGLFFRVGIPRTMLRHFFLNSRNAPDVASEVAAAIASVSPSVLGARVREVLSSNASDALAYCAAPVVFISAGADRLVGFRGLRGARRTHSGLDAVTIEGPHLLLQTRPVESAAVIRSYLQRWFAS